MKKMTECSQLPMKTCSICYKSSEAEGISLIYFGEWMIKKEITAHYYCLLLSTNLPQRGEDHSGILGFLLRDIRHEIEMAKKRKCKYCFEISATIQCYTCKEYFHLTCGHTSKCLSHFVGDFKSYCHACIPVDQFLMNLFVKKAPLVTELCFICVQMMGTSPERWIYAKCCSSGFIHSKCMKIYALSAGYYLTCIWCKDKRFREDIKYLGIFVPDRDANWEREKGAYGELYRSHKRCDVEICNCPKGRDYTSSSKWQLIICKLCGAFGAHNPACIPGFEYSKEKLREFKCDFCSVTEQTVYYKTISKPPQDLIDTSLYVSKDPTSITKPSTGFNQSSNANTSLDSTISQETIVNGKVNFISAMINNLQPDNEPKTIESESAIYALTQSPQKSQQFESSESSLIKKGQEETEDSDIIIANLLVQKMFDILEVNN